jgi:hypothetical protein
MRIDGPFVVPHTSPGEVQRRAQPKDASAEDDDRLRRVGHGGALRLDTWTRGDSDESSRATLMGKQKRLL